MSSLSKLIYFLYVSQEVKHKWFLYCVSFFFALYTSIVIIINLDSKHNNCNYLLYSNNCAKHKFNSAFKPDVQSK